MSTQEFVQYVVDERDFEWKKNNSQKNGRPPDGFQGKKLLDGCDGRPYANLSTQAAGFENPAHFHDQNQFAILLEGTAEYPEHPLIPLAVHYADANTAYGPFVVGPNFKQAVLRPRSAGQVYMSDREGRKKRNPYGRELFGQVNHEQWEELGGGDSEIERQTLIGAGDEASPFVQLHRAKPDAKMMFSPAPYGGFVMVVGGTADFGDKELCLHSLRYVRGKQDPPPIIAGEHGASILELRFGAE